MEVTRETSAAPRFASNAVILRVLGEQIRSLTCLRDLCLVNRLFHSEFVVYLYRELDFVSEKLDFKSPYLIHTRTLVAKTSSYVYLDDHDTFNEVLRQFLVRMPRLEIFVCPDTFDLHPATVSVLRQSCCRLKGIHIHYMNMDITPTPTHLIRLPGRWWKHDLSGFKGLQYLTLNEIGENLSGWRAHIVQILLASPRLKALNLSISGMTVQMFHGPAAYDIRFFDRLCDGYAAAGGVPLQLRSLRCGHAIFPMSHHSLAKLTNLKYLEEVEICNKNVTWGHIKLIDLYSSPNKSRSGIAFHAFGPKHSPNLRRFSAQRYRLDVFDYLCAIAEDKAFSRRLAVCVGGLGYRNSRDISFFFRSNDEVPAFPLRLRMVEVNLDRQKINWMTFRSHKGTQRTNAFGFLASSNAGSLEGLTVQVPHEPRQRWAAEFLELHVLETAVSKLPRLRQFAFNPFLENEDGETMPRETILDAAKRLAAAAPGLVYIGMYRQFWLIQRGHDGGVDTVELQELEAREWKTVELFYQTSWNPYRYPNWRLNPVDYPILYEDLASVVG